MKFVDEYRDSALARRIAAEIGNIGDGRPLKLMEVCGGHTHTIYKHAATLAFKNRSSFSTPITYRFLFAFCADQPGF